MSQKKISATTNIGCPTKKMDTLQQPKIPKNNKIYWEQNPDKIQKMGKTVGVSIGV